MTPTNEAGHGLPELLPCPFCGESNTDQFPCEWLDWSGANVIRCAWCHGAAPAKSWNRRATAALALSRGVPEGWKLVPIEPTWDMRNEGREFLIDGLEKEPEKLAYFLWKTMVAAAPEAQ